MNEQHFMTKTLSVRSSLAQGLKAKTLPKVKLHATSYFLSMPRMQPGYQGNQVGILKIRGGILAGVRRTHTNVTTFLCQHNSTCFLDLCPHFSCCQPA